MQVKPADLARGVRWRLSLAACLFGLGGVWPTTLGAAPPGSMLAIVSRLRSHVNNVANSTDTRVPPDASRDLKSLKHALLDAILATVSGADVPVAAPELLQARTIERIEAQGVPVGDEGGFGVISGIQFSRPKQQPDWLIATTSLGIPYGIDTSAYVFEAQGGSWKHILSVETNGYAEISGAQGWLTHHVVPGEPRGRPFLVTAEVTPWQTSVWQTLRLRVLRAGPAPDRPIVVTKRSLSYCLDGSYHVAVHTGRFELIYLAEAVDPELGGFRGIHYLEYRLGEGGAQLLHETAIDPYNVMHRWAAASWREASQSVTGTARKSVEAWHGRFRADRISCGLGGIRLGQRSSGDGTELIAVSTCTEKLAPKPVAYATLIAGGEWAVPDRSGFRGRARALRVSRLQCVQGRIRWRHRSGSAEHAGAEAC